jgi:hypothetical protein
MFDPAFGREGGHLTAKPLNLIAGTDKYSTLSEWKLEAN